MPDLLTSGARAATRPPAPRPPRPGLRRRSRLLAGASAAVAAAAVGLLAVEVVALVVWVAEPRSAAPLSAALRTGAAFWLLGHGGRLHLAGGTAALIPLGLSVLFAALAARAGATVARVRCAGPRTRTMVACALAVGVPYALVAALIAGIASGGGLQTSVPTALTGALVLAVVFAAVGAARELPVASPRPTGVRAIAAGVGAAGAFLIAVSALLAALSLVVHLSDAAALARPARAGAVGGFGLLALQAALTPNVVVWASAYLLGPGFAVGAGTLVRPTGVHLGDVPGLPMLAALPSGALPWPLYVLVLAPPAAGLLAGVVMVRRLPRTPQLAVAALLGAGFAVVVGVLAAALAAASGGPVTGDRLATIGPSTWPTATAAALEVGVPGILAALVVTWIRLRRSHALVAGPSTPRRAEAALAGLRHRLRPGQRLRRVVRGAAAAGRGLGRALGRGPGRGLGRALGRGLGTGRGPGRLAHALIRPLRSRQAPDSPPGGLAKPASSRADLNTRDDHESRSGRRPLHLPQRLKRKSKVGRPPG